MIRTILKYLNKVVIAGVVALAAYWAGGQYAANFQQFSQPKSTPASDQEVIIPYTLPAKFAGEESNGKSEEG